MLQFLKRAYLSVFVLGYRINRGAWPPAFNADAHKGVALVSIVELLLAVVIFQWVEMANRVQSRPPKVVIWIVSISIFAATYYWLVSKKVGTNFERDFDQLEKVTRVGLYLSALAIVGATIALFVCSTFSFRHVFYGG
jgi:hypothetical protein